MMIRRFRAADAGALADLFHASVREIGGRDYSPAQVAAWSPSPPEPEDIIRRAAGRIVLIAVNAEDEPLGYIELEPNGHIDHFYCRPDIVGSGIGSALYAALEAEASRLGIAILRVEASEAARRFFERKAFVMDSRNDFVVNGVPIHNYRMSKTIGAR